MHTVFALLCFVVVIHWLIFPYPSGLLHWHCGNLTIAPVPAKQPRWIWINTSCEFIMNDCITTTKQSTTKPCAYFLGYTVNPTEQVLREFSMCTNWIVAMVTKPIKERLKGVKTMMLVYPDKIHLWWYYDMTKVPTLLAIDGLLSQSRSYAEKIKWR